MEKATKCAVRALADTLRMEVLRLSGPQSSYTIHCAFPSNFIGESSIKEHAFKPKLTKRLEGTMISFVELQKRIPSAEEVARSIIRGVGKGDFAICNDSSEAALLFSNMTGPSPMRGMGIRDSFYGLMIGLIVWPMLRRRWDKQCQHETTVPEDVSCKHTNL